MITGRKIFALSGLAFGLALSGHPVVARDSQPASAPQDVARRTCHLGS